MVRTIDPENEAKARRELEQFLRPKEIMVDGEARDKYLWSLNYDERQSFIKLYPTQSDIDKRNGYTGKEAVKHFRRFPVKYWEMSSVEMEKTFNDSDVNFVKLRMNHYKQVTREICIVVALLMYFSFEFGKHVAGL